MEVKFHLSVTRAMLMASILHIPLFPLLSFAAEDEMQKRIELKNLAILRFFEFS